LDSAGSEEMVKSMKKEDPLMMKIMQDIQELPDNKQQEIKIQLENIFQQRIFKIKLEQHESK
jgi:hypothetical protein